MSLNNCGCCGNGTDSTQTQAAAQADDPIQCTKIFHEDVTTAAELLITPEITVTNIQSRCIGEPIILPNFPENIVENCSFTVEQEICSQFDVNFGVSATSGRTGLICGTPSTGSCPSPITCQQTSATESYTLALVGVLELFGGRQEWTYQLTNNSGHDISHWTFVSCTTTPVVVQSVTAETLGGTPISVTFEQTNNPEGSISCLTTSPQRPGVSITPAPGSQPTGTTITYHIITTQTYPIGTVLWGARAGEVVECGEICGPCLLS